MKMNLETWKQKKKIVFTLVTVLILALVAGTITCLMGDSQEEVTYRETTVQFGELSVGIENSGSVSIGTLEQTFDLDLSEYVSNSSSTGSSGMPGGMGGAGKSGSSGPSGMFGQMGTKSGTTGDSGTLEIKKVLVTTGQQVQAGDVLYELEPESVEKIRDQLTGDVERAKADLDSMAADNKVSALSAKQTSDMATMYGGYADVEQDKAVYELEKAIEDLEKKIADCQEDLEKEQADLAQYRIDYALVKETADAFKWSVDHMSAKDETALYVDYENKRETAQKNADNLEDSIEKSEDTIEEKEDELDDLNTEYAQAKRALEEGKLKAKKTYDLRMLSANTAQEAYDVNIGTLDLNYKMQEEEYLSAKEKLDEFDTNIRDNSVISEYAGVVTEVSLKEDDTVGTGTVLLTVYDDSDTTITVSVSDDDRESLEEGGKVNISFTAYPNVLYEGKISEIQDAETDNSGNITYPIEVSVLGDVSALYEGMTGDLVFVTKQVKEVTYVSNRAIYRDGTRSYVKVYDANGKIVEKDVKTGFSDGENVEITEGLSKGDVVLIESKVSD